MKFIIFLCVIYSSIAIANVSEFAEVEAITGIAIMTVPGKVNKIQLTLGESVPMGAKVETDTKSVVRLKMSDGSIVNIAPSTSIVFTATRENKIPLVTLLAGKIRAFVKKALYDGNDKMILQTKNAAMGIRGTDFVLSFDRSDGISNLLTIEGKVAFVGLRGTDIESALRSDRIVLVESGTSSTVSSAKPQATSPKKIPDDVTNSLKSNPSLIPLFKGSIPVLSIAVQRENGARLQGIEPNIFSEKKNPSGGPGRSGSQDSGGALLAPTPTAGLDPNLGRVRSQLPISGGSLNGSGGGLLGGQNFGSGSGPAPTGTLPPAPPPCPPN